MTDTPRLWDRRADETPKSYAAFRAYVALGARRSVREAARQHHIKALSAGEILGQENTTVSTWLAWSSKHKWISRIHPTSVSAIRRRNRSPYLIASSRLVPTKAISFLIPLPDATSPPWPPRSYRRGSAKRSSCSTTCTTGTTCHAGRTSGRYLTTGRTGTRSSENKRDVAAAAVSRFRFGTSPWITSCRRVMAAPITSRICNCSAGPATA